MCCFLTQTFCPVEHLAVHGESLAQICWQLLYLRVPSCSWCLSTAHVSHTDQGPARATAVMGTPEALQSSLTGPACDPKPHGAAASCSGINGTGAPGNQGRTALSPRWDFPRRFSVYRNREKAPLSHLDHRLSITCPCTLPLHSCPAFVGTRSGFSAGIPAGLC